MSFVPNKEQLNIASWTVEMKILGNMLQEAYWKLRV